jgi:hypothetical protein
MGEDLHADRSFVVTVRPEVPAWNRRPPCQEEGSLSNFLTTPTRLRSRLSRPTP